MSFTFYVKYLNNKFEVVLPISYRSCVCFGEIHRKIPDVVKCGTTDSVDIYATTHDLFIEDTFERLIYGWQLIKNNSTILVIKRRTF